MKIICIFYPKNFFIPNKSIIFVSTKGDNPTKRLKRKTMKKVIKLITVKGHTYKIWSDFIQRCTFAENEQGQIQTLRSSGYMSNEATIKRTIKLLSF